MSADRVFSRWVGAVREGRRGGAPLRVPARFVLAGVEWAAPASARIEFRARTTSGRWSAWAPASVLGHDAEGEAARHAFVGQPVWFGPSDAIELRSSEPVEGLSVHFVAGESGAGHDAEPHATRVAPEQAAGARRWQGATAAAGRPLATPVLPAGPGQPPIIARQGWAGRGHRPAYPPAYGDVRMAFVHHTDNPNGYGPGAVPAMLRAIYAFHRYVNGWNDIGYNFVVDLYGGIWEARAGGIDQAVCGAHAGGYNLESTGVALLGTFSSAVPTAAALSSLEQLLAWKLSLHGVPVQGRVRVEVDPADAFYTHFRGGSRVMLPRIAGHRDGCTTTCPGAAMYARLPSVRSAVARLAGQQLRLSLSVSGGSDVPARYLAPASASILAGQPVTLAGSCLTQSPPGTASASGTGGTAPVAGAAIELQSLVPATSGATETVLASATTAGDGSFSVVLSPTESLLVRALHASAPAAASPLVVVAVAPALTLQLAPPPAAGATSGGPVAFSGTVGPLKQHVTIDAYHATGHHRLAKSERVVVQPAASPAGTGSFSGSISLKPGSYELVARTPADARNLAGASPPVSLTV